MITSSLTTLSALPVLPIHALGGFPAIPAVYLFHAGGTVLYVGKTSSLKRRMQCHEVIKKLEAKGQSVNVSWVAVEKEEDLDLLELQYAHKFQPPFNRAVAKTDGSKYWWATPSKVSKVYLDISGFWPKDESGKLRSVNAVYEDLRNSPNKVSRNTLSLALHGRADRGKFDNVMKLKRIASIWTGKYITTDELFKEVEE